MMEYVTRFCLTLIIIPMKRGMHVWDLTGLVMN